MDLRRRWVVLVPIVVGTCLLLTAVVLILIVALRSISSGAQEDNPGMPFTVVAPGRARTATQRLKDGYAMEIAIPLADYYILPVRGASIGFDLQLRGATGTFGRYARREGRTFDGKRLARLYFE